MRKAGDRALKNDGRADSDARIEYRISVCSSWAASICQRGAAAIDGLPWLSPERTVHGRRGPKRQYHQGPVTRERAEF